MIGYLKPLSSKAEHKHTFRAYQCGLCHHIGETYGFKYRIFAGPDMVFYNVFLDSMSLGGCPTIQKRACVMLPKVSSMACCDTTDKTAIAAAFGIYIAIEKIKDNWEDDRSPLFWLAWKAFLPGWKKARATLLKHSFPVEEIEEWMQAQRKVEATPELSLEEASRPTMEIVRFGAFGLLHSPDKE